MALFLTDEEKIGLVVVGRTARGRIKPVPGVPSWAFSNPAAGAVFPQTGSPVEFVSADNLTATEVGTLTVTAGTLSATEQITVDPAPVVSLEIQAGAPVVKS